jgi:hypothetical protein
MKLVVVVCVFERNCLNVPTSAFLWTCYLRGRRGSTKAVLLEVRVECVVIFRRHRLRLRRHGNSNTCQSTLLTKRDGHEGNQDQLRLEHYIQFNSSNRRVSFTLRRISIHARVNVQFEIPVV